MPEQTRPVVGGLLLLAVVITMIIVIVNMNNKEGARGTSTRGANARPKITTPGAAGPKITVRGAGAGPKITAPKIAGPKIAGPKAAGPKVAGPKTAGPKITGPKAAGPKIAGPKTAARPKIATPGLPTKLPIQPKVAIPSKSPIRTKLPVKAEVPVQVTMPKVPVHVEAPVGPEAPTVLARPKQSPVASTVITDLGAPQAIPRTLEQGWLALNDGIRPKHLEVIELDLRRTRPAPGVGSIPDPGLVTDLARPVKKVTFVNPTGSRGDSNMIQPTYDPWHSQVKGSAPFYRDPFLTTTKLGNFRNPDMKLDGALPLALGSVGSAVLLVLLLA